MRISDWSSDVCSSDLLDPQFHRLVHDDEQHFVGLVRHRHLRRQKLLRLDVARVGQPIVPLDRLAVDLGFEDVGFAFLALPDHVRTPCMKAGPGWIGCRLPAYSETPGHASPVSSRSAERPGGKEGGWTWRS